ncbi:MAG: hypothetical protein ABI306_04410 [Caulobacteraceae bacterium]
MSEAAFRLAYDGDAVRDGAMDIADLAPALMGMAQLLKAAGRVVDGDAAEITVRVQSIKDACFEIWLTLAVDGVKGAWNIFKTQDVQASAVLLGLLGITAKDGAIALIRRLKGKRPDRVIPARPGFVSMQLDGDSFEVPDMVARLALDAAVRAAFEKVVAEPLQKDGIEAVTLGEPSNGARVEKSEGDYFKETPTAPDEFVSRHTKPFSILTLSFKRGQKWRLNDGASPRLVKMSDDDFQSRVDASQESFSKGDILVCDVVETSRRTASGAFKSDYEIVRVKEHRRAFADPGFNLDEPLDALPRGPLPSF